MPVKIEVDVVLSPSPVLLRPAYKNSAAFIYYRLIFGIVGVRVAEFATSGGGHRPTLVVGDVGSREAPRGFRFKRGALLYSPARSERVRVVERSNLGEMGDDSCGFE
jgi:hypothetical protein